MSAPGTRCLKDSLKGDPISLWCPLKGTVLDNPIVPFKGCYQRLGFKTQGSWLVWSSGQCCCYSHHKPVYYLCLSLVMAASR